MSRLRAGEWTALGAGVVLIAVHGAVTLAHGLTLPEHAQAAFGASPGSTFTRPWAHFTAPFFHYSIFHVAFNVTVLALTLPFAVRAFGVTRALPVAFLASPVTGVLVNTLVILPLASQGVAYAESIVEYRFVGASVVAYAGAGLALASTRASALTTGAVLVGVLALEATLAVAGVTRPFVGVYHATGFLLGLGAGTFLTRRPVKPRSTRA